MFRLLTLSVSGVSSRLEQVEEQTFVGAPQVIYTLAWFYVLIRTFPTISPFSD